MSFTYITGPAGSGKSALAKVLRAKGFNAFDEDDPMVGSAHNLQTGWPVAIPDASERDAEWFSRHEWRILNTTMHTMQTTAAAQPVILFGNSIEPAEQTKLFDKVIYLKIDEKTLCERILKRTDNDYGQSENEMQIIVNRKQVMDDTYGTPAVVTVDATKPLAEVADAIVRIIQ